MSQTLSPQTTTPAVKKEISPETTTPAPAVKKEKKCFHCLVVQVKGCVMCCWFLRYLFLLLSLAAQFAGFYRVFDGFLFARVEKHHKVLRVVLDVAMSFLCIFALDGVGSFAYLKAFYSLRDMKMKSKNRFQRYFPTCLKKVLRLATMTVLPLYATKTGTGLNHPRDVAFASGYFAVAAVLFCMAMLDVEDSGIADCFAAVILSVQISMNKKLAYLTMPAVAVIPGLRILVVPLMKFIKTWANGKLKDPEPEELPIFFKRFECVFKSLLQPEDLKKNITKKKNPEEQIPDPQV